MLRPGRQNGLRVCHKVAIRLYYYKGRNFGDALSPKLVERLSGKTVRYSHIRHAQMAAVGSILFSGSSLFLDRKRLFSAYGAGKLFMKAVDAAMPVLRIWGSGLLSDDMVADAIGVRKAEACALRGKHTRDVLERVGVVSCDQAKHIPLGDPGLLYPELLNEMPAKRYDIGIVLHASDREYGNALSAEFDRYGLKTCMVDVLQNDPLNAVKEIGECGKIVSSSLHGLVVADSLGIPSRHIVLSNLGQSPDEVLFKFNDYYSAFGIEDLPISVSAANISGRALWNAVPRVPRVATSLVEQVKAELKESFPL